MSSTHKRLHKSFSIMNVIAYSTNFFYASLSPCAFSMPPLSQTPTSTRCIYEGVHHSELIEYACPSHLSFCMLSRIPYTGGADHQDAPFVYVSSVLNVEKMMIHTVGIYGFPCYLDESVYDESGRISA